MPSMVLVVDPVARWCQAELDGEMGDSQHGAAGAADVTGAAQADGNGFQVAHLPDFYQPDPGKDWRECLAIRKPRRAGAR